MCFYYCSRDVFEKINFVCSFFLQPLTKPDVLTHMCATAEFFRSESFIDFLGCFHEKLLQDRMTWENEVNFVRSLFFVQRNLAFPTFLWRERDIENTNRRRVCTRKLIAPAFVRQWTLSWCMTGWMSSRNVCVSRFVRPRSQRRISNILSVWWHHLLHGCCSTAITFHNSRPLIVLYIFISSQHKQANYVISARIFHRVLFNIFMRGVRRHPTEYNEKFIGVL